jgi:hypothetical protein
MRTASTGSVAPEKALSERRKPMVMVATIPADKSARRVSVLPVLKRITSLTSLSLTVFSAF